MPSAPDADTRRLRPAALLAGGCLGALLPLFLLAAHTGVGRSADRRAAPRPSEAFDPWPTATRIFDAMDVERAMLLGALVVALALARRRPNLAAVAAVVVVGAAGAAYALKRILRHAERLGGHDLGFVPSFPSAHVTTTLALGLALVVVAGPVLRPAAAVLAAAGAAVMGVSAITIHAHRASDVVGALLLATGWAAAATLLRRFDGVEREWRADAGGDRVATALLAVGAAGALLALPAGIAAAAADDRVNGPLVAAWVLLAAAAPLCTGTFVRAALRR